MNEKMYDCQGGGKRVRYIRTDHKDWTSTELCNLGLQIMKIWSVKDTKLILNARKNNGNWYDWLFYYY